MPALSHFILAVAVGFAWVSDTFAETPKAEKPADPALHWSFQPVKKPAIPKLAVAPPFPLTPLDAFILAKLGDNGLSLSPAADRRTLIRRLKFDLLGLPPTAEEVEAFVADKSNEAYSKLVETYLASPQYGERWARHWLDAVRFAESNGFETNQPRRNAYHYRDWVINSLNADKPFDRFVKEQIAGDSLGADAATGFLVAGAWDEVKSPDITLTLQQRADELHDMVATTGSAFLGLTVGCARCHAHKFDPVPQVDYYRFKAVFAGVQHGDRFIRTEPGKADEIAKVRAELAAIEMQLAALEPNADPAATEARRPPVNAKQNTERFARVKAKYVRFVIFETNNLEPCLDELEVFTAGEKPMNVALASAGAKARSAGDYPMSDLHRLVHLIDGKYGNGRSWISNTVARGRIEVEFADAREIDRIVWGRDREGKFGDRLATRYRIDVSLDGTAWSVVASSDDRLPFDPKADAKTPTVIPPALKGADRAAWVTLGKQADAVRLRLAALDGSRTAYAGRLTTPEPTFRLHRGDATQKKEAVGPGVLTEIGAKFVIPENATDPQRRAALAEWIASNENPLTSRVIVNRLWQHHFGTGIVDTPSDFGRNGGKPTHPELLDWLATDFVEHGWSLKHLHRMIVLSATYKQSSNSTATGLAKDAQSRLLWRYPPRRIEAESLRDSILFVSGKLDISVGGPGFDLFEPNTNYVKVYTPKKSFGPAEFRRMIYQQKPRMQLDDTFGVFDCPDGGQITPKRTASTTPLQSLNLLNSTFVLQQAGYLAARVEKDAGTVAAAQVKQAFRIVFQRGPTEKELAAGEKLVREHGLAALCRAMLNANEFVFVD